MDRINESERLWRVMCKECEPDRVDMLTQAMCDSFDLIMHDEVNGDVNMALIGFISRHLLNLAQDGEMTIPGVSMLFQIGIAKGIAAHMIEPETPPSMDS